MSYVDIMPRPPIPDLLPGTLDLLILRTLQTAPLHGWAISDRIQQAVSYTHLTLPTNSRV